jgi:hypothetical protein
MDPTDPDPDSELKHLHHSSKINHNEVKKTVEINVFLTTVFFLDDGRIRSQIRACENRIRMRIREAQKHTHPEPDVDPNPQPNTGIFISQHHCFTNF